MGDMIRCHRCGTHHYRNDPCPDYDGRCGERELAYREKLGRALELMNDLQLKLVLKGESAYVSRCYEARGFEPPALATREATGKD